MDAALRGGRGGQGSIVGGRQGLPEGPAGPSGPGLTAATSQYLAAHKPRALDSEVEKQFRAMGWGVIWTPPYGQKSQRIELA